MMSEDRYFIVTHKFNGNRYRAKAESKTKLKKDLPRFNEVSGYMSYFDIEEVEFKKYQRMNHLPQHLEAKA